MKKNHRSIRDTAFCSILSVAMFFSLGVNSIAEESGDPSAAQPGTEVTETVEDPSPEPEPAPEMPAEAAAATEPEPAPEATPEVTEEVPAAPEETAAPEPTPTEVKAEETAVPEETPAPAESMAPAETAVPEETAEPAPTPESTPETEEEPADIYMLAGSFYGSTSKMTVTVTYDDHTFPQGTTMRVSDVSHSEAMAAAEQSTEGDEEVIDAVAVDITFLNASNEEIQPEGAVSVSMVPYTPLETTETSTTEVIHKDDSGSVETVGNADVSASGAEFSAEHFSIYVIKSTSDPAIATYIFHDADGNSISTQKVKNGETVYAPTTPEKNGYKFLGWSYTQNVSAVQTGDPGDFTTLNPSVKATGDVNLYPVFQQVYYVFFMDNQGRVSTTKEGVSGATIKVSDVKIPLDSTHSVTGWYTEAAHTNKVDSVTLKDHNVTLYPKVEEGHYLYFASGEGASYIEPEFIAADAVTTEPAEPTRPGYTFSHWSLSEEETKYSFGSTISENTTLYAVWTANTDTKYTVIYWWENANDDNYSYHESSVKSGVSGGTVKISKVLNTYPGFDLNIKKTNQSDVTISGDGSTIINIYYSRKEFDVKFYKYTRGWWNNSWDELTDLRISAKYGAKISDQWPTSTSKIWGTKTKKDFFGYEYAVQPYQSGISTMPLNGASFYYVEQSGDYTMNLNYYLEELKGGYVLDHTDSFKTNNPDIWSISSEDHYDIEGFTYTGNVADGTSFEDVDNNTYSVDFKYSRNEYKIHFVNGSSKTELEYLYGADISSVDLETAPGRPDGVPDKYTFEGWFDNDLGEGKKASLPKTMPAQDITLYAKWVAPTFDGTIHLTIEDNGTTIPLTVGYGKTIDENDMPKVIDHSGNLIQAGDAKKGTVTVPEGYTWAGWATKTEDGSFVLFNFNTKVHRDITLYPYYINGYKYSVTYSVGDGKGTAPVDSKLYAENSYADIQSASGITPPDGKTFLYWTADNAKYYPGDKVKITGNLELTASYGDTSKLTSITYNSNYPADSGLTAETKTVDGQANNTAITLDKAGFTAPDGYYFAYWKDASGTQYPVGTKIGIDNNTTSTNDLYAVWEKKKEITLKANSGTFTYDGSTHGVSGVETDQFTIDGITYTVSGYKTTDPAEINAGTYDNIVSGTFVVKNGDADVSERFTVKTENGKLTITQAAELTITITGKNATETYDGNEKSVSGYDVTTTLPAGITVSLKDGVKAEAKGTAAGEYPMGLKTESFTVSGEGTKNYQSIKVEVTDGKLTITQAAEAITITITGNSAEIDAYDGKLHSVSGFTVTAKKTEQSSGAKAAFVNFVKNLAAGMPKLNINVSAEEAGNADRNVVTVEGVPGITVALKEGVEASASGTDAGTYSMNLKADSFDITGTENYANVDVVVVDGTLKINPAPLKVTTSSAEKVYDGKALTASGKVEGLVNGETVELTTTGSQTDVGTSTNTYSINWEKGTAKQNNYKVTEEALGILKVTARPEPSKPKPAASNPAPAPVSTRFIPRTAANPAEGK